MYIRILLFICMALTTISASSQFLTKDKIRQGIGFAYLTDITSSKVFETTITQAVIDNSGNYVEEQVPVYFQSFGVSLFTFIYRFQYNVIELPTSAFTLSAEPSIGVSYVLFDAYKADEVHAYTAIDDGYGIINIPLFIGYEGGLGTIKEVDKKVGYFIKAGVEIVKSPIFIGQVNSTLVDKKEFNWSLWGQPVLSTGIRYVNRKQQLSEVNLKFGFLPKKELDSSYDTSEQFSTYHARISFLKLF